MLFTYLGTYSHAKWSSWLLVPTHIVLCLHTTKPMLILSWYVPISRTFHSVQNSNESIISFYLDRGQFKLAKESVRRGSLKNVGESQWLSASLQTVGTKWFEKSQLHLCQDKSKNVWAQSIPAGHSKKSPPKNTGLKIQPVKYGKCCSCARRVAW